jgi:type IV pilus assembly protein PilW
MKQTHQSRLGQRVRSGMRPASGFSLVELMVALVLGGMVVVAVINIFLGSRMTYMANEGFARAQETGRFALEDIKRDLREVGTNGFCGARLTIRNHLNNCAGLYNATFDPTRPINGLEFTGTGPSGGSFTIPDELAVETGQYGRWTSSNLSELPAALQGRVVGNSDIVFFRTMQPVPGLTAEGTNLKNAVAINLNGGHNLNNSIVLVTDCASAADLFQNRSGGNAFVRSAAGPSCGANGPGNVPPGLRSWSRSYDESMQVYRVQTTAYYVGINPQTSEPGLYRMVLGEGAPRYIEVADGIENMQVLYGFSLPSAHGGDGQSVNHWLTASQVPDWGLVIAARISVLARSPEIAGQDRQAETFDMAGVTVTTPGDGRIRREFSTTVALRNRVLVN